MWSVSPLEPRLMLAGDAGAAVADAAAGSQSYAASEVASVAGQSVAVQAPAEIAFVDSSVEDVDELVDLVRRGVEIVLIDSSSDAIGQMDQVLSSRSGVSALHIVSHGQSGQLQLGGQRIDASRLQSAAETLQSWRGALTADADILLYGCDAAKGAAGQQLLETWAQLTGADVAGSTDRTGAAVHQGNWVLEATVGRVEAELLARAADLQSVNTVLPITIRAAGAEGDESMELQIDGVAVQQWDNIGGDPDARQFQTFTYAGGAGVSADQVRIVFRNPLYDPAQGIDRDLRIDNIEINGQVYETEDPSVYGTGTWIPGQGFVPGYNETEWLHGFGYFQYAETTPPAGSEITIYAAGDENDEIMELWLDGTKVKTWENVGGSAAGGQFVTYQFTADSTVTADDVQIHFTNSRWDPAQGIDSNLRIDRIEIDGQVFETEDPSVFSTGTWVPGQGFVPGYNESEWLQGSGYFQYSESGPSGSQITIYAAGDENDEIMELWLSGSEVKTWENIGGSAAGGQFVAYQYTAVSTVTADDVQIHFTNSLWDPGQGIDRNLRIDRIEIDGVIFETEDPSVYSTGTWVPGQGFVPGYNQSEWLQGSGYFQYSAGSGANAGVISLATSIINVDEDAGNALVEVIRTGGSNGTVTIDYDTELGTAQVGVDYNAVSGTLTFEDGETSQTIVIPILDDSIPESIEQFGVAIDNPGGGATLLVPRTATVTIVDDDVALPDYPNFNSTADLTINGAASASGGVLELTPNADFQAGSTFFDQQVSLDNDGSFRSAFSFQITGGTAGADGMAFVIQDDPAGASALGNTGGFFGFEGITNSVAVEFDTYQNAWDVNNNHVSIVQGSVQSPLRTLIPDFDLNDGTQYYAWVEYNGISDVLAVYLSDTATKPTLALLKATVNLESVVGDAAYFGFSAGTGGLSNSHQVLSWQLDQQVPPQNPPTEQGDIVASVDLASNLSLPTAVDWLPNGTMLIAEKGGVVKTFDGGSVSSTPFIDISAMVNGVRDRGLLDIAVHPDFQNNPYVYLLFTYDPPEVYNQPAGTLAGPDGMGNRAARLIRVTADASNGYLTAVAGSDVVLLGVNSTWDNFNGFVNSTVNFNEPPAGENPDGTYIQDFINSDSESHTIGGLAFAPDGALYVSTGDGASYNNVDVRADRVQDIDSLSGKILRINPINGDGLSDNPFYNGDPDANRSKVYQLGLRNPFRISTDPVTGQLFVGDVGWTKWEEINSAGPGANFGWPFYEGGSGVSLINVSYQNTPEGQDFFNQNVPVDAAIYALNHQADGINAIVMGDVYRGSAYGAQYQGDVFFNDLGQGIVRHASIDANGNIMDVNVFTTGANVVVAISQGPDGSLYWVDLDDGKVGRWEIV